MKIILNKKVANIDVHEFLRRAGYVFITDRVRDKSSYVRSLGRYHYPRLHMYLEEAPDRIIFNLHLDQKQVSYEGSNMHSGEYDGPVVEAEIARLKNAIRATLLK